MTTTFSVNPVQNGNNLIGDGEKVQVDGKDIPRGQHELISLTGQVSGNNAFLEFKERSGKRRSSEHRLVHPEGRPRGGLEPPGGTTGGRVLGYRSGHAWKSRGDPEDGLVAW